MDELVELIEELGISEEEIEVETVFPSGNFCYKKVPEGWEQYVPGYHDDDDGGYTPPVTFGVRTKLDHWLED